MLGKPTSAAVGWKSGRPVCWRAHRSRWVSHTRRKPAMDKGGGFPKGHESHWQYLGAVSQRHVIDRLDITGTLSLDRQVRTTHHPSTWGGGGPVGGGRRGGNWDPTCRQAVQVKTTSSFHCSSVQFKLVYMRSKKAHMRSPSFSDVFPKLPLKQLEIAWIGLRHDLYTDSPGQHHWSPGQK